MVHQVDHLSLIQMEVRTPQIASACGATTATGSRCVRGAKLSGWAMSHQPRKRVWFCRGIDVARLEGAVSGGVD